MKVVLVELMLWVKSAAYCAGVTINMGSPNTSMHGVVFGLEAWFCDLAAILRNSQLTLHANVMEILVANVVHFASKFGITLLLEHWHLCGFWLRTLYW